MSVLKGLRPRARPPVSAEPDAPAEVNPEESDDLRSVVLEEFRALRQEIGSRSGIQHQLVALNMTVLATIGGFVISENANPILVLVIPILSPALGIFWHDHSRNIEKIGFYIMRELKPLVSATLGGDTRPLSYEERMRKYERMKRPRFPLSFSLGVLFAGCPGGALAYSYASVHDKHALFWFLFVGGILMTFLYVRMLAEFLWSPYLGHKNDR
jgi:hypothetical protein